MNEYYVYLHKRKNSKEVFYVGKGKNSRATDTIGRNKYWNHIVKKDKGFLVEIVDNNLSNDDACELEVKTIKEIGLESLTNVSEGGEGQDNSKLPPEKYKKWIENKSKAQTGKKGYWRGKTRPKQSEYLKKAHGEGKYTYDWLREKRPDEWNKNVSEAKKGLTFKKKMCKLCSRKIAINNFNRHKCRG